MSLAAGETFAGYTVIRPLGSGGMGEVYLVQHPRLPRLDALKILPEALTKDSEYRERFQREADLAATLWHPHIVGLHDRGESEGRLWISMDFVDGTDAATLLLDQYPGGLPPYEAAEIVTAIAEALDYAHDHQLLHRDVKPANILLTHVVKGRRRILLADFGIARDLNETNGLTKTNMTVGSVLYAAPEQLTGDSLDSRADQYALAATAFHLLTGQPPFSHSNPAVVIGRHLTTAAPKLSSHCAELVALDPVFNAAMSKDPVGRFNSCSGFALALNQRLNAEPRTSGETQAAIPMPPLTTVTPPDVINLRVRKRRALLWGTSAAVLLLIAGTVYGITRHQHPADTTSSSSPVAPLAVLDGTYRLDSNFMNDTVMGSPNPPPDGQPKSETDWRAFRSACTPTGCTATETALDATNHELVMTPLTTHQWRLIDGRWQELPEKSRTKMTGCSVDQDKTVDGDQTLLSATTLTPLPDGSLRGLSVTTIISSECGTEGAVHQSSFTATRIGDLPPKVVVADPSTVSTQATPAPAAAAPGVGPVLDGTFSLEYDYSHATNSNGVRNLDSDSDNEASWWAFRSACTDVGCVATGASLDPANHQEAAGGSKVLHFDGTQWLDTPRTTRLSLKCWSSAATEEQTLTEALQLAPQPDATLTGSETETFQSNECGLRGVIITVPIVARRTGPLSPTVVLADPLLFTP